MASLALAPRTITIGFASVYFDPGACYVRTQFPDGAYCEARPNHTDEDRARAAVLGYVDVEAMTLEHDPAHSFLAAKRGDPYSPTLWSVAHGLVDDASAGAEEEHVIAFQHFLNRPHSFAFPAEWRGEFRALLEGR